MAARATPTQRSEGARKAVQASWTRVNQERETAGMSRTDASDSALLTLLDRIKTANDPEEIRALAAQIERVVFRKA